jgi:hypothetical protein
MKTITLKILGMETTYNPRQMSGVFILEIEK